MESFAKIIIFTDGASRGNPGPGGWGAVLVRQRTDQNGGEVIELGSAERRTTNNRMELTAAIEALVKINDLGFRTEDKESQIKIFSDSSYLINGITKWVHGWRKKGWKTMAKKDVENRDLWEKLIEVTVAGKNEWNYIGGHAGVAGNERCDEIATAFADGNRPALYQGELSRYPVKNILSLSATSATTPKNKEARQRSRAKAFSYVSKVNGIVKVHKTWAECERRVKGKSGARFKKALNAEEEKELVREWKNR